MTVDSHMYPRVFQLFDLPVPDDALFTVMRELMGRTNAYFKTSGVCRHTRVRIAVERVRPDRVRLDSETSFHHPSVGLAKVRVSGPSTDLTGGVLIEYGHVPFLGEQTPTAVA